MEKPPQAVAFVQPTLARAVEIAGVEPIVSYFCKLHAVQQVLETKLHLSNPDVAEFATNLLTDIETLKSDSAPLQTPAARDILENDELAKEYVTNFASKVFERADKAVHDHKVTRATAVGFIAASVFLDLERVWQPLSAETAERIKYAKFHAAQILRAIKAGQDPNELYAEEEPFAGEEDELAQLENSKSPIESPAPLVNQGKSDPSLADSVSPEPEPEPKLEHESELEPEPEPETEPEVEGGQEEPEFLPETQPQPKPKPIVPPKAAPKKAPAPQPKQVVANTYKVEDVLSQNQVIDAAQKHAKYAISALNFEDLATAMSELTVALGVLKNYEQQRKAH